MESNNFFKSALPIWADSRDKEMNVSVELTYSAKDLKNAKTNQNNKKHGNIKRKNRLWLRRHGIINVLEDFQRIPSIVLCNGIQARPWDNSNPHACHTYMGCRL